MHNRKREKSRFNLNSISHSPLKSVSTTGIRGGFSALSFFSKKAIAILIILLVSISGILVANVQSASAAQAGALEDWTCDNYNDDDYKDAGRGQINAVPDLNLALNFWEIAFGYERDKLTAYEVYGTSGTTFASWLSVDRENIDDQQKIKYTFADGSGKMENKITIPKTSPYWSDNFIDCTGLGQVLTNGIANLIFIITKDGVSAINNIYGIATDSTQLVEPLYGEITKAINGLQGALYTPFILLIIMFGALWIGWVGLVKRKSTEAFNGALWMLGAAIAGALLFINPTFIVSTSNQIVEDITQSIGSAITNSTTDGLNRSLCSIDKSSVEGHMFSNQSRVVQCAIWYNLVYTPWVVGQFGTSPSIIDNEDSNSTISAREKRDRMNKTEGDATSTISADKARDRAVIGGGATVGENGMTTETLQMIEEIDIKFGAYTVENDEKTWPLIQMNAHSFTQNLVAATDAGRGWDYIRGSDSAIAYQQLVINNNSNWKGVNAFSRISTAFMSMNAMLATALIIILFSMMIIIYKMSIIFLMMFMPLFLLVGVHPGFGRRLSLRWLEMIVNLTIKQIMISVMLAIFIMLYGFVLAQPQVWFVQNVLIVVITIVGLMYMKKIMNMFADVDFGGDKKAFKNDGPSAGKKIAGAAVGAVVAGFGASSSLSTLASGAAKGAAATSTLSSSSSPDESPTAEEEPESKTLPARPSSKQSTQESQDRISAIKKKTIRAAALQGSIQGFSGGGRAILGATLTGMQMGDNAHDNEVAKQESEGREIRENERDAKSDARADKDTKSQEDQAQATQALIDELKRNTEERKREGGTERTNRDQGESEHYTRGSNWTPVPPDLKPNEDKE